MHMTKGDDGIFEVQLNNIITEGDGDNIIVIPRSNPINAYTMFGIIKDAGLTVDEFKKYL